MKYNILNSTTIYAMLLKMSLKICFLLGCFAVLLSTCEAPNPNTEPLILPQPKGDTPPVTCEVSNVSQETPQPKGTIIDPTKEPFYEKQWYLCNTDEAGIHINIAPVWQKGYGTKAVDVGILDEAIDTAHPDLAGSTRVEGFEPYNTNASHGTKVAGILAARDNGKGIIGVAPRARIYGYGVITSDSSQILQYVTKALKRPEHKTIAVYSASIGDKAEQIYSALPSSLKDAMDTVTNNGFNGKGSSLVFAAGNSLFEHSYPSNTSYLKHHAMIAVNAIGADGDLPDINKPLSVSGMARGANLWITAPSNGMITTDNGGGYEKDFGSTSGATPLVSGAIALLRSKYPQLTWRDVKLILAESARKHDDTEEDAQYRTSGKMHSSTTKQQQYSIATGFGLLDVDAAFALAEYWTLLPVPMKTHIATHDTAISFTPIKGKEDMSSTTSTLDVTGSDIPFIESVTIGMNVKQEREGGGIEPWTIWLTSPDNTKAKLSFASIMQPLKTTTISLLVNSFLGNMVDGRWTLKIEKTHRKGMSNEITKWSLTFRGH